MSRLFKVLLGLAIISLVVAPVFANPMVSDGGQRVTAIQAAVPQVVDAQWAFGGGIYGEKSVFRLVNDQGGTRTSICTKSGVDEMVAAHFDDLLLGKAHDAIAMDDMVFRDDVAPTILAGKIAGILDFPRMGTGQAYGATPTDKRMVFREAAAPTIHVGEIAGAWTLFDDIPLAPKAEFDVASTRDAKTLFGADAMAVLGHEYAGVITLKVTEDAAADRRTAQMGTIEKIVFPAGTRDARIAVGTWTMTARVYHQGVPATTSGSHVPRC